MFVSRRLCPTHFDLSHSNDLEKTLIFTTTKYEYRNTKNSLESIQIFKDRIDSYLFCNNFPNPK